MFKIDIDDFIFEVKEELTCYEDIGKKGAADWETGFKDWLLSQKAPLKTVKLDDESEIFEIADEYIEALEENKAEQYWKSFKL